jgi:hypothetical protein
VGKIDDILAQPADETTAAKRVAALLGSGETLAFHAISLGDLVYDRVSIDPQALEAFDFVHRSNAGDIHALSCWSHHIILEPSSTYEGSVNRLQGYVFEKMAALSLRERGAIVQFPNSPNQPGWDFLVNGEHVQAKCGLSPRLVTEHLMRYPEIPRVVVNEDLASHFADNDHIVAIHGVTQEAVRSATEHSLGSAADMLDLHLASVVPAISVIRNAYHLLRGNTDWSGQLGNLASDTAGRYAGASAAKAAGVGAAIVFGLSGWPALLLPVFAAAAGYRSGRALSDKFKRQVLLRNEYAALTAALRQWCGGSARVLNRMVSLADAVKRRFLAARERAQPDYFGMIDGWLERIEVEQNYRRFHLARFERGTVDPWIFEDGSGPLGACASAMLATSRAGILPADLSVERKLLTSSLNEYANGLRRRLLRR